MQYNALQAIRCTFFSQKSSTPNKPRKTRIKMHYLVPMVQKEIPTNV